MPKQWAAAWLAVSLLAGCTVFAEDEPEPATIQAETDDAAFPAVGSVPDAAPEVSTTAEERAAITEELMQDNAAANDPDAVYTQIETPPPVATTTPSALPAIPGATGSALPPVPAASIAAPGYYATEYSAGGQVAVDYSVLDGYGGGPYASATGYYGAGAPGQPVALIYFAHGSAALSAADRRIIGEVAQLQKAQGGVIRIVGHASMRTGNASPQSHEDANYRMSLARANAIAEALMREGLRSENVQAAAQGSAVPVYYEFTPTGEAGNRRAEIYLVN
jgi:outer membrane protein OmpA-like peptidoglycan-associated protein